MKSTVKFPSYFKNKMDCLKIPLRQGGKDQEDFNFTRPYRNYDYRALNFLSRTAFIFTLPPLFRSSPDIPMACSRSDALNQGHVSSLRETVE